MIIPRTAFVAGFFLLACAPRARTPPDLLPSSPKVVGYLASWNVPAKRLRIARLPASELTHIFYAFGKIGDNGRAELGDPCVDVGACGPRGGGTALPAKPAGNFRELQRLKARHPHLKLAISIGGWTGSGKFSDVALTAASREKFVESAVDLFIRRWPGVFDGIDIDWEFPVGGGMKGNVERPADRENFTLLLAELRRQLEAQGARDRKHYELTIAASARPSEIANIELGRIIPLLDFIAVMTYDYHTGGKVAHLNAPLFAAVNDPTPGLNTDASIRAFVDAGVPVRKLLIGIPFFARAYGNVPNVNRGLFQTAGNAPADWKGNAGDWDMLARTRLKDPRYVRHWEPSARVPFLFDPTRGIWISYDDPQSVAAKARYVRERGLGGVIIWEVGADDGTLMRAIAENLPLR